MENRKDSVQIECDDACLCSYRLPVERPGWRRCLWRIEFGATVRLRGRGAVNFVRHPRSFPALFGNGALMAPVFITEQSRPEAMRKGKSGYRNNRAQLCVDPSAAGGNKQT